MLTLLALLPTQPKAASTIPTTWVNSGFSPLWLVYRAATFLIKSTKALWSREIVLPSAPL